MNLTQVNLNAGSRLASIFQFDGSAPLAKTTKTVAPVYYVEGTIILNGIITIEYTLNDEWQSANIKASDLRLFVIANGMSDYCFDSCANGMHLQDAGSFDPDTFITENLNAVIKAYLQSKRIGQNVN